MNADRSRETLAEYAARWERLAPLMQEVRDSDIRTADTAEAMRIFSGSAMWAVQHRPTNVDSGLIDQQRWFQELRVRR